MWWIRAMVCVVVACGCLSCSKAEDRADPPEDELIGSVWLPRWIHLNLASPLPEGWVWEKQRISDFVLYRAKSTSDASSMGLYVGHHPRRDGMDSESYLDGVVAGMPVCWQVKRPEDNAPEAPKVYQQETLIRFQPEEEAPCLFIQVWIAADSESALKALTQAARTLVFEYDKD
jgi:hypothetical protein